MYKRIGLFLLLLIGMTINAQTINVRGKVTNKSGKPIPNATVTIVRQNLKDTTGADGSFSIIKNNVAVLPPIIPTVENVFINKGVLEIRLVNSSSVKIEVFDLKGKLLNRVTENVTAGVYRLNLADNNRASNILIIHASIGKREMTFQCNPLQNGKSVLKSIDENNATSDYKLAKIAADVDTIRVSAFGYITNTVAISSYDIEQNITLDSSASNVGPSAGCGKSLGSLKTGTYKITSSNTQREYTINIPANYNPNKPYRLIFCWHWINASDDAVANGQVANGGAVWAYYGLKNLADSANDPAIFIAPQSRNGRWDQQDHVLFDDLLKMAKGQFCIDTTRVFATGFSFGAMQTYSLSLNHQKQLRAVACLAAANYNIYLPTNTHEPIAYLGIVGMSDGTCPPSAGLACAKTHATDNGCVVPATVTQTKAGSKTHVIYDFQGCKEKYPVRFITFDGGHIAAPADGGTSDNGKTTWASRETWKFFTQF